MNISLFNFLFPRMCCICKRYGNYICDDCKKLLKRNLPECYICRRLSPSYVSHIQCRKAISLNSVFVAWEYNRMSSSILKLYKYKSVKDVSDVLSDFFIDTIEKSTFKNDMSGALLIPIPISNMRKNERGFNQMQYITSSISRYFDLDINTDLIYCKNSKGHQASKSRLERYNAMENPFYINKQKGYDIHQYKSIILVDDVITTGSTLEKVSKVIKAHYGSKIVVNALCMFRGKPYFLPTE